MIPYYALIGIPLMFAICYELIYEKGTRIENKKNYIVLVFFFIYFLLLALRSKEIGVDTTRYISIYNVISEHSWAECFTLFKSTEYGYIILNKIVAYIFDSDQALLVFVAVICVLPMAIFYYKESKNSLVSIALFLILPLFQMNFSGLRQAIAIAFVVPAFYCIKNKLLGKFIMLVIIAMFFHKSAFMILLMYPIYSLNIKLKNVALLVPIGLIVFKFKSQIFLVISGLMGEIYENRFVSEIGAYAMLIVYILFTIYAFLLMDEMKMDNVAKGFRNYLVVATFLQMFASVNIIATRMNYYFVIFIPLVITQINQYSKIKDKRFVLLINVAMFTLFIIYYVYKANATDNFGIYPYTFFFKNS